MKPIRQGDVFVQPVSKLPAGCVEIPLDNGRDIVLAWGEVTNHSHAIRDVIAEIGPGAAAEMTEAVIARAKARLWQAPNGDRFLEVLEPVPLTHEEHTAHTIARGIGELPIQVEESVANAPRQVAD